MNRESASVVITGVGPVSAIGSGRAAFWDALTAGETGFGPVTVCDVADSPSKIGAEVKGFSLRDYLDGGRLLAHRMPRAAQFALAAAQLAFDDASWSPGWYDPLRVGVVVGTSLANMNEILRVYERYNKTGTLLPHAAFALFHHSAACLVGSHFDLRGPVRTTTCGCNSGLDAIGCAASMIRAGEADAVLAIGTDCELVPEVFVALNAAGALATHYNDWPSLASRPFDTCRDGNVLGEGAAALLLENESLARQRAARAYARFAGYRVTGVGQQRIYDARQPNLDAAPCAEAFRTLLGGLEWQADEVDAVSANGSSSVKYDALEGRALQAVFGERLSNMPVHSTKSMLGQHGAGSSALQAVAAVLSLHEQLLPPTVNCDALDPDCGPLMISKTAQPQRLRRVLTHAIGFGGFYYSVGGFEAADGRSAKTDGGDNSHAAE